MRQQHPNPWSLLNDEEIILVGTQKHDTPKNKNAIDIKIIYDKTNEKKITENIN